MKLFHNAAIVTPQDSGKPLSGPDQGLVRRISPGAVLCERGIIRAVGRLEDILKISGARGAQRIDCNGLCMIPGFVDPHTHMCFVGAREQEFELRLRGVDYLEILNQGGGILSSVRQVRTADETALFSQSRKRLENALRFGTTTVEIKSGYGLDAQSELKMLRVIDRLAKELPLDVVATFLGAHAIPEEYRNDPEGYVGLVISEMIPSVARQGIARFCDVFCEKGAFSVEQSRRILEAARCSGLIPMLHADEMHDSGGAGLAARIEAICASHLLFSSAENLAAMAKNDVVAVLLPATAYSLRKDYPSARSMVQLGVALALATDCNPGSSYTESMPFVFGLAVLNMRLSVEEALTAATLNAAYALGMAREVGSLDVGKKADFILLDGKGPAILAYHAGVNPVVAVYKQGCRVA